MLERIQVKLDNYGFSGLDSSQIGAVKSVADYYQMSLTPTEILGFTGLAFLNVFDENFVQPNAGPPEPDIFRLVRNLGIHIEGIHQYADGAAFIKLQADAWDKAKAAIDSKKPVFSKNIAQENQTSVITAFDDIGYYIDSWHTGYENGQDVIPWNLLGLSRCPCVNCVNDRKVSESKEATSGLISLHWATPIPANDKMNSMKEALQFVLSLNEKETYEEFGKRYFVGLKAFEEWINAIESNRVLKYDFALVIEVVSEARHHANLFLTELKQIFDGKSHHLFDEAISTYGNIATKTKVLKDKFPYEQPRESFNEVNRQDVVTILRDILLLERKGLSCLREICFL
ncbi:hypothetical protein ACFQZR_10175 [Paenibacillus sp. GCM10027629]|uniref:hypothetical protein n=1 Tax=Paenibacillus sp. GCM10027629 TaxID=3273414 RepID=UPI00362C895A